ncbi:MAG: cytochrome c oxidase subunit II [Calditrichaeota bacterium]|nr:cytochrome c oxidase subunit II [Calditrichota bacterium]MCB9365794.1 cytochrome c oxidase subunit II [Calditrichota bacterium]
MRKQYLLWLALLLLPIAVFADPVTSWIFDPATPVAGEVRDTFHIMLGLTLPFLLLPQILLVYAIWKFNEKRGHKPATFHDNLKLEIIWTVIPVLTLIAISIPAYSTLKKIEVPPKSDLVVEVIGHQFFWEYRLPKYDVGFANEPLVVPADKIITLNLTSVDVIHSWWVPSFGVKQDANPGRITHAWFKAPAGKYKGQCAELCGPLHGEMWIDVQVVSDSEFETWLESKQNGANVAPNEDGTHSAMIAPAAESEAANG